MTDYSYDRRTADTVHQPLYGHNSPETAFMVDDYPYGSNLRCRIRYWLESDPKKGFRFCSQTEDPRKLRWNNPKKSTYMPLAGCMYLDERKYCVWRGLSQYDDGSKVLDFVKSFPHADFSILQRFCKAKIKFLEGYASGSIVMTINDVPKPRSEEEIGETRKDLASWVEVSKHIH